MTIEQQNGSKDRQRLCQAIPKDVDQLGISKASKSAMRGGVEIS